MTRHLRFALAVALALAQPAVSRAATRPLRFQALSIDQGLSQTTVLSMLQDSQGFLWFGTEDGLNRYDGAQVHVYSHDPANASSLPANVIWGLAEDAAGDIWIATEGGGVARWQRRTDQFVRYAPAPGSAAFLASDKARSLLLDAQGLVWIGTRDAGLDQLDPKTGAVRHFRHAAFDPESLGDDAVYALIEDGTQALWVGTDAGLSRLDLKSGKFTQHRHDPKDPRSLPSDRVRALRRDSAGVLWVATEGGGLAALHPNGGMRRFRSASGDRGSLNSDFVQALLEDSAGRLWIGTRAGLALLEGPDSFARYEHSASDPVSLSDDDVMSLYEDRTGVLWAGTRAGGVNRFNPRTWSFGLHRKDANDPSALEASYVTGFSVGPEGRLFVGTLGGGVNVFDRTTGRVTVYKRGAGAPGSLSDDRVMALLHDRQGTLWVGTMDGGLNRLDAKTGRFTVYRHEPGREDSLSSNAIMSLLEDRRGTLWVGTFGSGLNALDPRTGSARRFRSERSDTATLSGDVITSLAEDATGGLWVGTDGAGLNYLRPGGRAAVRVLAEASAPGGLAGTTVFALHVAADGQLWVGTRGGGLSALTSLDPATGRATFKSYGERAGLPNGVVYGIHPDAKGNLWLSTNRGLAVLERDSQRFRSYTVEHGLQSNEFNFGAHYKSAAGELLFGGPAGFNAFVPEKLEAAARGPALVLTGLQTSNGPAAGEQPVFLRDSVVLSHREQGITFEFGAMDFAAPGLNRYSYRLEGFDGGFIDNGSLRRASYTNLDPGRYVFRVRAKNADGLPSERELAVSLRVLPPPWKTWWAYLLYALAIYGALYAFVSEQQRRLSLEAGYSRRLEAEVRERTGQLASQNTELAQLNAKLLETSLTDSLTGLRNRRFLFEEVAKDMALVERARSSENRETADAALLFIMVDLDWFKPINDTCGHAAGDRVLVQVKEILESACRKSDVLVRWGGDEFLVVGRQADLAGVEVVPERIRALIENTTFDVGNGQVARLTCSVGFALYPWCQKADLIDLSLEHAVALADSALYLAKRAGRNAWVGLIGNETASPHELASSLRESPERLVESGQFELLSSRGDRPALRKTADAPRAAVARMALQSE